GERAALSGRGRPAIVAEADPPASVLDAAEQVGAPLLRWGRHVGSRAHPGQWDYWGPATRRAALAYPALRGQRQLRNAAAALAALDTLRERLPVSMQDVRRGGGAPAVAARDALAPVQPRRHARHGRRDAGTHPVVRRHPRPAAQARRRS